MDGPIASLTLHDKALIAEYAEAAAWTSYLSEAPAELALALNVKVREVGGVVLLCAPGTMDPFYNRAIGFGLKQPMTPELLDSILESYEQGGANEIYIQVSPAVTPVESLTWLEERGFYPNGSWVKLVRGRDMPPYIETGLDIQIIGPDCAHEFADIIIEVFGLSGEMYSLLHNIVGKPGWQHYVAYDSGNPAAAAAMYSHNDVAWLGFMGTRQEYRGRGAQNALITRRIYDAIGNGCQWIVSDTLEHAADGPNRSLRNLERLGFEVAYWRINFMNF